MATNFNLNAYLSTNGYGLPLSYDLNYLFKKIDTDGDNKLSRTEISNFFNQYPIRNNTAGNITNTIFNNFDKNFKDDSIDLNELLTSTTGFDTNQNNIMDLNETISWINSLVADEVTAVQIGSAEWYNKQFDNALKNGYSTKTYASKYADTFNEINTDKNETLTSAEITNFFNRYNTKGTAFTAKIATSFNSFDLNNDGFDKNDFALMLQTFDQDRNGSLDAKEDSLLFSFMTNDFSEVSEAGRIFSFEQQAADAIRTMDSATIDSDNDGVLESGDGAISKEEYKSVFKRSFLTPDLVDAIYNIYAGGDNKLTLQELTKFMMNIDSDKDGTMQFSETLVGYNNLYRTASNNGASLNNIKNLTDDDSNQFKSLFNQYTNLIKQVNASKTSVNSVDFNSYLQNLSLTNSQANSLINQIDTDKNGIVDANDFNNFLGKINSDKKVNFADFKTAIAAVGLTEDQVRALFAKLSPTDAYITGNDFSYVLRNTNTNIDISKADFVNYYKQKGFSDNIANTLFDKYNSNGDGKINVLELVNKGLEWDTNKTGKIDLNFEKNMYHEVTEKVYGAGKGLSFSNVTSQKQLNNLISSMGNFIKVLDGTSNGNNEITETEYKNSLVASGVNNQDLINNLFNYLNAKGITNIDALSLAETFSLSDANNDGNIDNNEKANFYRIFSNNETNIKNTVLHDTLVLSINNTLKTIDTDKDGYVNQTEYAKILKSDSMAAQMVNKFGSLVNGQNVLDLQDLIKITSMLDKNLDGKQTVDELMSFYTDLSDGKLDKLNTVDNAAQYQNLNKVYTGMIAAADGYDAADGLIHADKKDNMLSKDELKAYLRSQRMPESLADEMFNKYDKMNNGKLDIYELINMGLEFNTERVKSYSESTATAKKKQNYNDEIVKDLKAAVDYAGTNGTITKAKYIEYLMNEKDITEENANTAADLLFKLYDEDTASVKEGLSDAIASKGTNGTITKAKYIEYLTTVKKQTAADAATAADTLFSQYDEDKDGVLSANINGFLNSFEILKNELTEVEMEEKVNEISDATQKENALANFAATDTSVIIDVLKNIDSFGNKDGKIQKAELEAYLKQITNAPRWLTESNIIDNFDDNADSTLDTKELLNAALKLYNNKITRKTGALNLKETMAMYDKLFGSYTSRLGKKLSLSNISSASQYTSLMTKYSNVVRMFDTNKDGAINTTEFNTYKNVIGYGTQDSTNVFGKYDINRDGKLDILELLNMGIDIDKTGTPDGMIDASEEKAIF